MRLRLFLLFVFFGAVVAAGACSLNPQPYPPENYDASVDGSLTSGPDATGTPADGAADDGSIPGSEDAATDAGDASLDAAADATDAESDAADAGDDGSDAEVDP